LYFFHSKKVKIGILFTSWTKKKQNMSNADEIESFNPDNNADWRTWLEENHESEDSIWLIIVKKSSNRPNLTWHEAVDQALCFGWVDGEKQSLDRRKYEQFFSKRKPDSPWSKIDKEKIDQLTKDGLIAEAGLKCVEVAKENGAWAILDSVEALIVPEDLQAAFDVKNASFNFYNGLKKAVKKSLLEWIILAENSTTRQERVDEIAEKASIRQLPEHLT
jgi:uncharacterized protein YdeI (YjbR/CyaY-like superfamily)